MLASASVLLGSMLTIAASDAATTSVTITPAADAYVVSSKPTSNYGTGQSLKEGTASAAYVRFIVSGTSTSVSSAALQIYTRDRNASYRVSLIAEVPWAETSITWATAPTDVTASVATASMPAGWQTVDLSALVTGDGTYSLRVDQATGSDVSFSSRESQRPPKLVLDLSVPDSIPTSSGMTSSGTTSSAPTSSAPTTSGTTSSTPTTSGTTSSAPTSSTPTSSTPTTSGTTSSAPMSSGTTSSGSGGSSTGTPSSVPPLADGYFNLRGVGSWSSLPDDAACASQVHRSTWEPRPDNAVPNHTMPDAAAVHNSLATRPRNTGGSYDNHWDTWLLPRVDGQFTGTTDEIMQWAACKWGLPDNVVRAIAVRESTWYQAEVYPSGRCVTNWGCGDMVSSPDSSTETFCNELAKYGYDYQLDYGAGICPKTFSIAGVMSWQAPSWGQMAGNQNGTFPFNRNSTAFALDYLGAQIRGCYEGWEKWLGDSGTSYAAGDLWGCVGSWYSGAWHDSAADGYISRVQGELANHTWLTADWPSITPGCSKTYGCPTGRS